MRNVANHALSGLVALALSIALIPASVDAQEQQQAKDQAKEQARAQAQETCAAEVAPAAVQSGQAAVRVTATLPSDIGAVDEVHAPEESGLALAEPGDIPRKDEMAREGEGEPRTPEPVTTASGESQPVATVWLSTENATPGSYQVALKGETGKCTAELEVSGQESPSEGEDQSGGEDQPGR